MTPDYTYTFSDITRQPSLVTIKARRAQAPVSRSIVVNDDQLTQRQRSDIPAIIADLTDLAAAIQVADRLGGHHNDYPTHHHVILPVRQPDILQGEAVTEKLGDILYWFTGDIWTFDFRKRQTYGRVPELQMRLEELSHPTEVALWSGGLDALAGLYHQLKANPDGHFTLCSDTNGNRYMQGVQRNVWEAVQRHFPNATIKLEQIGQRIQAKEGRFRGNFAPRTRGFVFLLVGIVGAYLEDQKILHVYENGIGALNLAFTLSATGLDHSRAVHPRSLCQMSELATLLLGSPFEIKNPFLYWTKAQMCRQLIIDRALDLIHKSVTCDRRQRDSVIQCGRCSSCLLRRQALLANGLDDGVYVVTKARQQGEPLKEDEGDYFYAMDYQVQRLRECLAAGNKWQRLTALYPDLGQVASWLNVFEGTSTSEIQEQIMQLYKQYITEWDLPGLRANLARDLLPESELLVLDAHPTLS